MRGFQVPTGFHFETCFARNRLAHDFHGHVQELRAHDADQSFLHPSCTWLPCLRACTACTACTACMARALALHLHGLPVLPSLFPPACLSLPPCRLSLLPAHPPRRQVPSLSRGWPYPCRACGRAQSRRHRPRGLPPAHLPPVPASNLPAPAIWHVECVSRH